MTPEQKAAARKAARDAWFKSQTTPVKVKAKVVKKAAEPAVVKVESKP